MYQLIKLVILLHMLPRIGGDISLNCEAPSPEYPDTVTCSCKNADGIGVEWLRDTTLLSKCFFSVNCSHDPSGYTFLVNQVEQMFIMTVNPYNYGDCQQFTCKDVSNTSIQQSQKPSTIDFDSTMPPAIAEPVSSNTDGDISITTSCISGYSDLTPEWYIIVDGTKRQYIPDQNIVIRQIDTTTCTACNSESAATIKLGFQHKEAVDNGALEGFFRLELSHPDYPLATLSRNTSNLYKVAISNDNDGTEVTSTLSTGTLAGIIVGCIAFGTLIVIFIICCVLHWKTLPGGEKAAGDNNGQNNKHLQEDKQTEDTGKQTNKPGNQKTSQQVQGGEKAAGDNNGQNITHPQQDKQTEHTGQQTYKPGGQKTSQQVPGVEKAAGDNNGQNIKHLQEDKQTEQTGQQAYNPAGQNTLQQVPDVGKAAGDNNGQNIKHLQEDKQTEHTGQQAYKPGSQNTLQQVPGGEKAAGDNNGQNVKHIQEDKQTEHTLRQANKPGAQKTSQQSAGKTAGDNTKENIVQQETQENEETKSNESQNKIPEGQDNSQQIPGGGKTAGDDKGQNIKKSKEDKQTEHTGYKANKPVGHKKSQIVPGGEKAAGDNNGQNFKHIQEDKQTEHTGRQANKPGGQKTSQQGARKVNNTKELDIQPIGHTTDSEKEHDTLQIKEQKQQSAGNQKKASQQNNYNLQYAVQTNLTSQEPPLETLPPTTSNKTSSGPSQAWGE